jgi:hypothetical protein
VITDMHEFLYDFVFVYKVAYEFSLLTTICMINRHTFLAFLTITIAAAMHINISAKHKFKLMNKKKVCVYET